MRALERHHRLAKGLASLDEFNRQWEHAFNRGDGMSNEGASHSLVSVGIKWYPLNL